MEISTEEIDDRFALVGEYYAAKADADLAQERLKRAQQALLSLMEQKKVKTIKVESEGKVQRFTYVAKEVTRIDEKGLRKELTAKVFDRFTDKKLNRSKLEAAMQNGLVDPMIVSKHVEIGQGQPYLRISEGAAE